MNDIIGISAYYHDSSVALIRDGKLIAFLKEESLTRVKGISNFPKESLNFLIKNYGVCDSKLETVCFYEKPLRGWLSLLSHSLERPFERWRQSANLLKKFWDGPIFFGQELKKTLPISNNKIIYCEHHLSHALTGLLFSDQTNEAAVIVFDGSTVESSSKPDATPYVYVLPSPK